MSPFEALYGYQPSPLVFIPPEDTKMKVVANFVHHRQPMSKLIKANLMVAQNRIKLYANKKRPERQFEVED